MIDLAQLEKQFGLPSGLLEAQMKAESSGNPSAVSPKGALGLFQFMPETAREYGINPLDPDQSAIGAARMNADMLKKYGGNLPSALAAYNWGQGNVDRRGLQNAPSETKNYISKIMGSIGNSIVPSAHADDLSHMSDAELEKIAMQGNSVPESDLSHLSDEELQKIAGEDSPGFFSRVGEDLKDRFGRAVEAYGSYKEGQQPAGLAAYQMLGKTMAGGLSDIVGEGLSSAYSTLVPDSVQSSIKDKLSYVAGTPFGQGLGGALGSIGEGYRGFAGENPNAARTLEATANLAMLAPIGRGGKAVAEVVEDAGSIAKKAITSQMSKERLAAAQKLVMPVETKSVLEDQVGRTTERGLLGTKTVAPTAEEKSMAEAVSKVKGFKASNTAQSNYSAVQKAVGNEAENLKSELAKSKVIFPRKEFDAKLNEVVKNLEANPTLTGDASKTAQKIVDQMRRISAKQKSTPSGLLQARKDLDKWVMSQKGAAAFDPVKENAISVALREIRQTTNSFIGQKAPHAGVQESLRRQNLLYKAMDNIAPKAAGEAKTNVGRVIQKVGKPLETLKTLTGRP